MEEIHRQAEDTLLETQLQSVLTQCSRRVARPHRSSCVGQPGRGNRTETKGSPPVAHGDRPPTQPHGLPAQDPGRKQ